MSESDIYHVLQVSPALTALGGHACELPLCLLVREGQAISFAETLCDQTT